MSLFPIPFALRFPAEARDHATGRPYRLRPLVAVLLLLVQLLQFAGASAAAGIEAGPQVQRVEVGGYRLYVSCLGSGSPTVFLSGRFVERWDRVQPRLAQFTRTCAYDRAGNGMSGAGHGPTTAVGLAQDLHRLIVNGKFAGPAIVVGEGFDGDAMQVYARLYRRSTAGLVLVDAIPKGDFHRADLQLFGIQRIDLRASRAEILQAQSLGDLPLVVISHGVYLSFSQEIEATWRAQEGALAGLSTDSVHVIATRSGYGIPYAQPEIVVEAVAQILLAEKTHSRLRPCAQWLPSAGAGCPAH